MPGFKETMAQNWPQDVGILALEVYFPSCYVDQTELEAYDGVSQGKYTIGLGQSKMSFCSDREDINSLCLTVLTQLVENNKIGYDEIGRLEVGTETIIDKSKSVKTVLMQLFEDSGNTDVEGIDTTNACYGGTSALINAINWVESSSWDGRYAVVIAGDIAVYATGAARPTGGVGAIAMLIGPNAPLVVERGVRSTYMKHVYDFYKPNLLSEYPTVDGKLSIECYLSALDSCYQTYSKKASTLDLTTKPVTLNHFDAFVFHSPYCKLVQKSFARLAFNDFLKLPMDEVIENHSHLAALRERKLESTYFDKDVEKAFMDFSKKDFVSKTSDSLLLPKSVGNMYTASVYSSLVSHIASNKAQIGHRIGLFSYGSGMAATMFSLKICEGSENYTFDKMAVSLANLQQRLDSRIKTAPNDFASIMKLREDTHHKAPYTPVGDIDCMFPGTWYLTKVDELHRREYQQCPKSSPTFSNGIASSVGSSVQSPLHPNNIKEAKELSNISDTSVAT